MDYYGVDREQMFELAGIEFRPERMQTPATVGKKNAITIPRNTWADQFRNLNFFNVDDLEAQKPENVSVREIAYINSNGEYVTIPNRKAITGDDTDKMYAIHSDRYEPVQHSVIVQAMTDACRDTSLSVFGHLSDDGKGRFNGYGTFANPDVKLDLGLENRQADPVMLGMRFFNSHTGDSKFGGEIYGIRAVCQNYMAWGETLGKVSIMHFKSEENVADELAKILMGYVDQIDALKDRVHYIRDTPVSLDEQEAILWGIGLPAGYIENILTHKVALNPEMATSKGSVWDIYNASTAFVTYHVGGSHTVNMNLNLSEKIEGILTKNTDKLISKGIENKEKYLEQLQKAQDKVRVKVVA